MSWVELLGYSASVLVAISLTMSNIWRLRWINLAGSATFTVYGIILPAYPVAAVNAFIAVVNLVFLYRLASAREARERFDLMEGDAAEPLAARFAEAWRKDLLHHFPDAPWPVGEAPLEGQRVVLVLRDLTPASLCVYTREGAEARIHVDYAAPPYRDTRNARFMFERLESRLRDHGVEVVAARAHQPGHAAYLRAVGFEAGAGEGRFVKRLSAV